MIPWLSKRKADVAAIEAEAQEMLRVYGSKAYETAFNIARDERNKGDKKSARHWAEVASYVARTGRHAIPEMATP